MCTSRYNGENRNKLYLFKEKIHLETEKELCIKSKTEIYIYFGSG